MSGLSAVALGATLLSYRIITRRFGPTDTDAFFLALGLLNVVIAPAYNAVSSTLIPALVQRIAKPPSDVRTLLGSTILWVAIGSTVATLLVAALAADGLRIFGAVLTPSTARLVRMDVLILGPLIAIQAVGAVLSAASQAIGRYWAPAVAVTLQQLVITLLVSVTLPVTGIAPLPLAFTLGALSYLIFLVAVWPWRARPMTLTWRFPADLVMVARLAVPLLVGSIAQQTALVGLRLFASRLVPGAVTAFDLAYRLVLAIVEVSSGGAMAVALTEWSTAVASGQAGGLGSRFRDTLGLVVFAVLPIPVLVHALRELLVRLWLSPESSGPAVPAMTAAAMAVLLWGVPLEICCRLYARVLLARGQTRVQGSLSALRMVIALGAAWLLIQPWRLQGLVSADVLASTVALVGLHRAATKGWVGTEHAAWGTGLAKIAVPAAACWAVGTTCANTEAVSSPLLKCLVGSVGGLIAYILVARVLHVRELSLIVSLVRSSGRALRQTQAV